MGSYDESRRSPMAWQSTLGAMRAHGTAVILTGCACRKTAIDIEAMIATLGPDADLWDVHPICARCGRRQHYMASPGDGTPFRPLISPAIVRSQRQLERRAFFKSLGLTRRDVIRIRAMAEGGEPPELSDLDVPIVVALDRAAGAVWKPLGQWAGRPLAYREMNVGERELWSKRPKGPRPV